VAWAGKGGVGGGGWGGGGGGGGGESTPLVERIRLSLLAKRLLVKKKKTPEQKDTALLVSLKKGYRIPLTVYGAKTSSKIRAMKGAPLGKKRLIQHI